MKYQENLSFSHPILYVILVPIIALMGYGIVQQLVLGSPFGDQPLADHWLIITGSLPVLILLLLSLSRLRYRLDNSGIHYRFIPFHLREQYIGWDEVREARIRQYDALREFGGWGIRINFSGNKAYNVIGDRGQGLEIEKKNGKKVLFSTRKPQEISRFLSGIPQKG
ncbi:MAG: hypothetical protein ACLFUB_18945 [Cyclobacteriaceae bacterium]